MIPILVTGDRYWTDVEPIRRRLESLVKQPVGNQIVVVQGGAKGVDQIAAAIARELGLTVITVPAQWKRYRSGAGPKRNRLMLELTQPAHVIAFHPDILKSKGTRSMVNLAQKAGMSVEIHDGRGGFTLLAAPIIMTVS